MKEDNAVLEDISSISEIDILADGRICLFGASRQVLEVLETLPMNNSDLHERIACFCEETKEQACVAHRDESTQNY
jgi:hypothetical protein